MKQIFIIIGIIVIAITGFLASKKTKILNEIEQNDKPQTEISSFDLNVKIPKPDSDFIDLWRKEMEAIGLSVEFHPKFDINNQSGFLPFKIKVTDSSFTKRYGNEEWIAGFELYISDFDSEEFFSYFDKSELDAMPKTEKNAYDNAELDFFFAVKPQQNSGEYRMGWYAASTLTKLYNGILEEAYSGKNFTSNKAIEIAISKTKKVETELSDDKWNLKKFDGWN